MCYRPCVGSLFHSTGSTALLPNGGPGPSVVCGPTEQKAMNAEVQLVEDQPDSDGARIQAPSRGGFRIPCSDAHKGDS
jgi:hypothetical protein